MNDGVYDRYYERLAGLIAERIEAARDLVDYDDDVLEVLTSETRSHHRDGYYALIEVFPGPRGRRFRPTRTERWRTPEQAADAGAQLAGRLKQSPRSITVKVDRKAKG